MSDSFKKRLRLYQEGKLSESERKKMEEELQNLEEYQEFVEQSLENDDTNTISDKEHALSEHKRRRIMRRGKWGARLQTAATVFGIFIIVSIISGTLTGIFFGWGDPPRMEQYQLATKYSVAITEPNVQIGGGGSNSNWYFNSTVGPYDLRKQVGNERVKVGEISVRFLLGMPSRAERNYLHETTTNARFHYPYTQEDIERINGDPNTPNVPNMAILDADETWNSQERERLEHLPDGTVAEAYISFDQLYSTEEVLTKLSAYDLRPLWHAAYTGIENDGHFSVDVLGFPHDVMWMPDDWEITSSEQSGSWWFGQTTTGAQTPGVREFGDAELRDSNFRTVLQFLVEHERIFRQVAGPFHAAKMEERVAYVLDNDIELYGTVITAPTNVLLDMQDEDWVHIMQVGEVRLWNW